MKLHHLRKYLADATPGDWDAAVEPGEDRVCARGPYHILPEFEMTDEVFSACVKTMAEKSHNDARLIHVMKRHFPTLLAMAEVVKRSNMDSTLLTLMTELEDL